MERLIVWLDRVSRYAVLILAGMTPLWVLPLPVAVEFGREVSFLSIIAIGGVAWILSSLLRGKIRILYSPILLASVVLLLVFGVSTLLSSSWRSSALFWDPAAGRISVIASVVFAMILASSLPQSSRDKMMVIGVLFGSGIVAALITLIQLVFKISIFGVLGSFAGGVEFNPVGTLNGASLLYVVFLVLGLGVLFSPVFLRYKQWIRYGIGISVILFFVDIFLINFSTAWITLVGSGVILLGLVFHNSGLFERGGIGLKGMGWRHFALMGCLLVFLALSFWRGPLPFQKTISLEVRPSFASTIGIVGAVYNQSAKAFLVGSGPGTFVFDWARYHDPSVNRTIFWGVRFNEGSSWLVSTAATSGILGFLALIGFFGVSFFVLLRNVLRVGASGDGLEIALLASIGTLILIAALYPATITFLITLFFLIGALSSSLAVRAPVLEEVFVPLLADPSHKTSGVDEVTTEVVRSEVIILPARMPAVADPSFLSYEKRESSLRDDKELRDAEGEREAPVAEASQKSFMGIYEQIIRFEKPWSIFVASLCLILSLGVGIVVFGHQIVRVKGAMARRAGESALARGDLKTAETELSAVLHATPNDPSIARVVTELGIAKVRMIIAEAIRGKNVQSDFRDEVARTIERARHGVTLSPEDAEQWRTQGALYELIIPFIPGAEEHAIGSYRRAAELAPMNPQIWVDQGRAYSVLADRLQVMMGQGQGGDKRVLDDARSAALADAIKALKRAGELKPDFSPAALLLAQVNIRKGDQAEAIKNTELAKVGVPQDIGVAFQLGLLYYQTNDLDRARAEFERAVSLNNDYANARYFLGIIYDRQGDHEAGIVQFEYIEKFNPNNEEVKKILENLRAGRSALDGIVQQPTPPVVEVKPETTPLVTGKESLGQGESTVPRRVPEPRR